MKTTTLETIDPKALTTVGGGWGRLGPGMLGWGGVGRGGFRNFFNGQRPGAGGQAGCPSGNCG
jgi:hypothetical protein